MNGKEIDNIKKRMKFTYDEYGKLLELLRMKGYVFSGYHNYMQHERTVIIRHDVDMSLKAALEMAILENRQKVSSTYFILISSDFYNSFSRKSTEYIKEIERLGHGIGLHFDETKWGGEISK